MSTNPATFAERLRYVALNAVPSVVSKIENVLLDKMHAAALTGSYELTIRIPDVKWSLDASSWSTYNLSRGNAAVGDGVSKALQAHGLHCTYDEESDLLFISWALTDCPS